MNDQELIAQANAILDNDTPVGWTVLRDALWAYRREYDLLKGQQQPKLPAGLKPLSGRQATIYDFSASYFAQRGYSPSVRDIAEAVGLLSSSTVHGHLDRLEKKGYITRHGKRGFTINGLREGKA